MALLPRAQRCAHHADRFASALCMSCRSALCQECATTWEGINYCARCLPARRHAERRGWPVLGWLAWLVTVTLLAYASVHLIAWSGAVLAGLA